MIQWKPGFRMKVRVMTHHLCHWKEQWHLLYTFLYGICLQIFGIQQTAGKIMNIMFFMICHSSLRFLSLTWIFEKWQTYIIYNFNKLASCVGALWPSSRVHILKAPLHSSTGNNLLLQSVRWLKNHSARSQQSLLIQPLELSLAWVRSKCRGNGVGTRELPSTWAQTSREPCALRALSRAPSVTPP